MPDKSYIINRVKEIVKTFDPDAEVILFGSRVYGTATNESDWDFLILTEIDLDFETKKEIRHALYTIEWETCEVISPIIHTKNYWSRPQNRVTPFYINVTQQGIAI